MNHCKANMIVTSRDKSNIFRTKDGNLVEAFFLERQNDDRLWNGFYLWFSCLHITLTLNCIRYPDLPSVHKGVGFMETPKKTIFQPEFLIYTLITPILQGEKIISFQNDGKITDFLFASFRFRGKFEKKTNKQKQKQKQKQNKTKQNKPKQNKKQTKTNKKKNIKHFLN